MEITSTTHAALRGKPDTGKRKAVFFSGWIAAAALCALWAADACRGGADSAPEAESAARQEARPARHVAKRPAPASSSRTRRSDGLEPWQRGVKVQVKNAEWEPFKEWDVRALYETLGNVPPDVRRLADRIAAADSKYNLAETLACVREAEACPNPVVRAMMVKALRWYASVRQIRNELDKKTGLDENSIRQTALDALKPFAFDGNAFVSKCALNTWAETIVRFGDAEQRLAAFESAVDETGGMVFKGNFDAVRAFMWMSGNRTEVRNACTKAFAHAVETSSDEDARAVAKRLYECVAGEPYYGPGSADAMVSWRNGLREFGARLFGSDVAGESFARWLEIMSRGAGDAFVGTESDYEEASRVFSSPIVAVGYVCERNRLMAEAERRYGDTEKGAAWLAEELAFNENRMRELDERFLAKEREEAARRKEGER